MEAPLAADDERHQRITRLRQTPSQSLRLRQLKTLVLELELPVKTRYRVLDIAFEDIDPEYDFDSVTNFPFAARDFIADVFERTHEAGWQRIAGPQFKAEFADIESQQPIRLPHNAGIAQLADNRYASQRRRETSYFDIISDISRLYV